MTRRLEFRKRRPVPRRRTSHDRFRQNRRQVTRVETIFLVEGDVFWTLREREKTGVRQLPPVEAFHYRLHQLLGDTLVPIIRMNGQWPEETDATPSRGEVRSDESAVVIRGERGTRIRAPARFDIVHIGYEVLRIRHAQESSKSQPYDARGFRDIVFS